MLSRIALGAAVASRSVLAVPKPSVQSQIVRGFRSRGTFSRKIEVNPIQNATTGLKGKMGPMEVGQLAVAGGAVFGLGSLSYYGLGLSNEPGAVERSIAWPKYVRDRIQDTYMYFGASAVAVAGSAITVFRTPMGHKFMAVCERHPILSFAGIIAGMIGTSTAMRAVPYSPGFGSKQALWLANCGMIGLAIAPVGMMGGTILIRAAWYTAGIVGGLSTVAACAPSDAYLKWAGPLGIGLGGVFVASIGSMLVPATSTLGLSLYSISLYGGLLLFSGFLLYDTQKIVHKAENHPYVDPRYSNIAPYDPIVASHHIVMDAVNIFVRIAQILFMGGGRKK